MRVVSADPENSFSRSFSEISNAVLSLTFCKYVVTAIIALPDCPDETIEIEINKRNKTNLAKGVFFISKSIVFFRPVGR